MFNNIFKIIFLPHKIKTVHYDTIFVGIIILFYFWFSPMFRYASLYTFFVKSIFLIFFIFINNVLRAFFYPIKYFRIIFPYYMLSLSPLLLLGFFSFFNYYFLVPFLWIELLKGYKDFKNKNYISLFIGTIIDTFIYILLWR
ncbi:MULTISPECIES: hypothetical protein [unclassified Marinitoga]|uniref:hypothetical protein n=1 Tax=unclassified Marinitoga TaxID=2640159 RepID=UPI0006411373|nr:MULTISPECIES: hypothetical protein [unclassified Marinitoga]KLO23953.1 hypothetical protein X274_05095 [Marinitoga sp. 1155]NUU99088.1 hypothetical protein [Marinitoga sp. 1154]